MKIPYTFTLSGDSRRLYADLPLWCNYPMNIAEESWHYREDKAELVSQELNFTPFFINLLELKLARQKEIPFEVHDTQVFLFFMLRGELTFTEESGKTIAVSRHNTFLISVYGSGKFAFRAKAGKHAALIINLQRAWLRKKSRYFPNIADRIQRNIHTPYYLMQPYRANRMVRNWMEKLFTHSGKKIRSLEVNLLSYMGKIMEYYDKKIVDDPQLAYDLKNYLDKHYLNPGLNVTFLADHFHVTTQTLLNHFKRHYNSTVQDYYTTLRMEDAWKMIKIQGLSYNEVYDRVGYTDIRSFRSTFDDYVNRRRR